MKLYSRDAWVSRLLCILLCATAQLGSTQPVIEGRGKGALLRLMMQQQG
jgi:hypothetical protein